MLYLGNNIDVLQTMQANSVDSIVTDPPYGLAFMNKKWDYDVPTVEFWREALRVLKPGGHVLSFGGTRTYHRMVINIEDAGFEIRDQLQWLYGTGFPKSMDISKAIDKAAGVKRKRVNVPEAAKGSVDYGKYSGEIDDDNPITSAAAAAAWHGWGTALKPANEPIVLARKPLSEKTIVANIAKWGVGGLNIDGCRIGEEEIKTQGGNKFNNDGIYGKFNECQESVHTGRFPANIILDETAAIMLDEQSGICKSGAIKAGRNGSKMGYHGGGGYVLENNIETNSGGASRFFYIAKASKAERNAGLNGRPRKVAHDGRDKLIENPYQRNENEQVNFHPTVKPVTLMEYLVKLITPVEGVCLDPFIGSGTTAIACLNTNREYIGIEQNEGYYNIAKQRINSWL